jgi:hypothetical protein
MVPPSLLLGVVLSWGILPPGSRAADGDYVGVLERTRGERVWARVAFERSGQGWAAPLTLERIHDHQQLELAPHALPAQLKWQACRDGRSLGAVQSKRRRFQLYSELGTQTLPSRPGFLDAARYDRRFTSIMLGEPAIRPFVISTLPGACRIKRSVRRADPAAVARLASAAVAEESSRTGEETTLRRVLGWQAGAWTAVEVEFVRNGAWGTTVLFAVGDEIRHRVDQARVVDWLAADADETPDVLLWTTRYNRDGYVLLYANFQERVEFEWLYH